MNLANIFLKILNDKTRTLLIFAISLSLSIALLVYMVFFTLYKGDEIKIYLFDQSVTEVFYDTHLGIAKPLKIESVKSADVTFSKQSFDSISLFDKNLNKQPFKQINAALSSAFASLGDSLCADGTDCRLIRKEKTEIFKVHTNQRQYLVSEIATIKKTDTDLLTTKSFIAQNFGKALAVSTDDPEQFQILNFLADEDGDYQAQFNNAIFVTFDTKLIPFALIVCLAFFCFTYLIMLQFFRERSNSSVKYSTILTSLIGIWFAFIFAVFYPGLHGEDNVISQTYGDTVTVWFTEAYQLHDLFTRTLGLKQIQLPMLLIWFVFSAASLNILSKSNCFPKTIQTIFAIAVATSPFIFVSLIASQRFYVAVGYLFVGLALFLLSFQSKFKMTFFIIGIIFIVFASLMRTEYILVLLALFLACLLVSFRVHASRLMKISIVASIPVITIILFVFVNTFSLPLYTNKNYNRDFTKEMYELVPLIEIMEPYVNCNNDSSVFKAEIQILGTIQEFCEEVEPQWFFWNFAWKKINWDLERVQRLNSAIKRKFITQLMYNPRPFVEARLKRFTGLLFNRGPNISSFYSDIEYLHRGDFSQIAARHNLLWDRGNGALNQHIQGGYWTFFKLWPSHLFWSIIVSLLLIPLIARNSPTTLILNAGFIMVLGATVFLAPASSWPYLIYLPIWCIFFPIVMVADRRLSRGFRRTKPTSFTLT